MKRIFYFIMASVLCVAACQKVDPIEQIGEKGEVAFTVSLPGNISTKAIADGTKALKLYYATYTDGDNPKMIASLSNISEGIAISGKEATVRLQLVKDLNYDVVFWAQAEECTAFTLDWTNASLRVNYEGAANDDYRDAFYAVRQDLKVTNGVFQETVKLYRPFAQINFGAADYQSVVDYYSKDQVDNGMQSALVVAEVPNTLNLIDETLGSDVAKADFTLAAIPGDPDKTLSVNGAEYRYVSMNYILAPKGSEPAMLSSITANFKYSAGNIDRKVEVKNVPYLRNHRTNIVGNFFTEIAILNIVIDEEFQQPDYNIIDPSVEFTQKKLDNLARIPGTSLYIPAGNWNLPSEIADGVQFIGADGAVISVAASTVPFTVGGAAELVLNGTQITSAPVHGIDIADNSSVKIAVNGDVLIAAARNGVNVPVSSSVVVYGVNTDDAFNVYGGNGIDTDDGGCGIGGGGDVTVESLASITAEGYGIDGYGIGGAEATVIINGVESLYARGGYPQAECLNDPKYGKNEPEGAPAIGGALILIEDSTIDLAEGGSKAAAIGARYHQNTDITIRNSVVMKALGGNASAGIGGSRYSSEIKPSHKQIVKILIENSEVIAFGGQYGAGIGAGYDTHCTANDTNAVNDITIVNSTITATGGKYAAGIGTGYHSAALTGSIDAASIINAVSGDTTYKVGYTIAQNIGYGVVDPAREYKGVTVTFTMGGTVIATPEIAQ